MHVESRWDMLPVKLRNHNGIEGCEKRTPAFSYRNLLRNEHELSCNTAKYGVFSCTKKGLFEHPCTPHLPYLAKFFLWEDRVASKDHGKSRGVLSCFRRS